MNCGRKAIQGLPANEDAALHCRYDTRARSNRGPASREASRNPVRTEGLARRARARQAVARAEPRGDVRRRASRRPPSSSGCTTSSTLAGGWPRWARSSRSRRSAASSTCFARRVDPVAEPVRRRDRACSQEDVVSRRRAWYWRGKYRLVGFVLLIFVDRLDLPGDPLRPDGRHGIPGVTGDWVQANLGLGAQRRRPRSRS